jgi:hypothetical protein
MPASGSREDDDVTVAHEEGIEFLVEGRPGEVATPDTQVGENTPNLVPVTTVIADETGTHAGSP